MGRDTADDINPASPSTYTGTMIRSHWFTCVYIYVYAHAGFIHVYIINRTSAFGSLGAEAALEADFNEDFGAEGGRGAPCETTAGASTLPKRTIVLLTLFQKNIRSCSGAYSSFLCIGCCVSLRVEGGRSFSEFPRGYKYLDKDYLAQTKSSSCSLYTNPESSLHRNWNPHGL